MKRALSLKSYIVIVSTVMVFFLIMNSIIIGAISYKTLYKNVNDLIDVITTQFLERHKDLLLVGDIFTLSNKTKEFLKKRDMIVGIEISDKKHNLIIDEKEKGIDKKLNYKQIKKNILHENRYIGEAVFYIDFNRYKNLSGKIILTISFIILFFVLIISFISITMSKIVSDEIKKLETYMKEKESKNFIMKTSEFRIKEIKNYIMRIKEDISTINFLESEIERKNNLAMIGNFTASIVHDIRNPLTVVLSYSEIMEKKTDNNDIKNKSEKIKNSATKIKRMLDDILSFVKEKDIEIEIEPRIPEKIIKGALDDLEPLINRKMINIEIKKETNGKCLADGYRLSRAIENIIKNAIEASEKKQKIEIRISEKDTNILFKIRDYAGGIPEEIKETIFEAFTTKSKKTGTGLGLFITKNIIDKHKGKIYFVNKTNGTEFVIEVPKA